MDKYTFWITFTSIVCLSLIVLTGITSLAWVYSPTTWTIEVGLNNESMVIVNDSLELASSISQNFSSSSDSIKKIDKVFDDNDLSKIKRYLDGV